MGEALPQIRDGEDGGEPPHQIGTEISRNLARVKANERGLPDAHDVHAFNQRSVEGIPDMIRTIGAMVEARERAEQLVATLEAGPDADCHGARRREQPGSSERASVARGGAGNSSASILAHLRAGRTGRVPVMSGIMSSRFPAAAPTRLRICRARPSPGPPMDPSCCCCTDFRPHRPRRK